MIHYRLSILALTLVALLMLTGVGAPPVASAAPPGVPSAATARSQLDRLETRAPGSTSGYSRAQFPHWSAVSGTCNAREFVLRRDGTNVRTDAACVPISGSWFSPYDGQTRTDSSQIDIDHVVPLAAAWRAGASSWTTARREQFANDVDGPALIAVTANVNRSKGDQTPDLWKPPVTGYWCTYARMWIGTKSKWGLAASAPEKTALRDMLGRC